MKAMVSMFRGINVSGQKKILMEDLKNLYVKLGFKNPVTYIQSGNVIFKPAENISAAELKSKIENAVLKKYGFSVSVILRTGDELNDVLNSNPLVKKSELSIERMYVTFLDKLPEKIYSENIKSISFPPDKFIHIKREVYIYCPESYGNTKLTNNFFEKKLNVSATTRNWKTVNKLTELASELH